MDKRPLNNGCTLQNIRETNFYASFFAFNIALVTPDKKATGHLY